MYKTIYFMNLIFCKLYLCKILIIFFYYNEHKNYQKKKY